MNLMGLVPRRVSCPAVRSDSVAVILLGKGQVLFCGTFHPLHRVAGGQPRVSCLLLGSGRPAWVRRAIQSFRAQSYPDRELIVFGEIEHAVEHQFIRSLHDDRIVVMPWPQKGSTKGRMRSLAIDRASGEYLCHWDASGLSHPRRLELQLQAVTAFQADACMLMREQLVWPAKRRMAKSMRRPWENTLLFARSALPRRRSALLDDPASVAMRYMQRQRIALLDAPELYSHVYDRGGAAEAGDPEAQWQGASSQYEGAVFARKYEALRASLPAELGASLRTVQVPAISAAGQGPSARDKPVIIAICSPVPPIPLPPDVTYPEGYMVTYDFWKWFALADFVVFDTPYHRNPLPMMPVKKPAGQLWVAWSMESDEYYPHQKDPVFTRQFDLAMTYHRDSDVWAPYIPRPASSLLFPPQAKTEEAPAVFFASNLEDLSGRKEYVQSLMRHIRVDSYGRALNNRKLAIDHGRSTKIETIARYKFTLAFENSIAPDYVTEKFFEALAAGSVPVYMGAPNVADFAPARRCFINTADWKSPRELASYLQYLADHDDKYDEYLAWKKEGFSPSFQALVDRLGHDAFFRLSLLRSGR